jgi:competence ComEA-like helix-hairpin-helix protein
MALLAARVARAQGKDLDGVVNLNTAPADLLELLPGIGPAKVRSIVAYRQRRPFRTVDELVRIKGIGRKMVRRMRVHLAVSGPSTAHAVHRPPGAEPPPLVPLLAPRPAPPLGAPAPGPPRHAPTPSPTLARPRPRAARASEERRSAANHCARPP